MKYKHSLVLLSFVMIALLSCVKTKLEPVETYPKPPTPLVKFLEGGPIPLIGSEGSVVTYFVSGLEGKMGQFKFLINQTEAEVLSVDGTTIKIKVPAQASTGAAAVLINNEYYFGPTFTIRGKVSIEALFNNLSYKSNGSINGIFKRTDGSSYMLYGSFSDYAAMATPAAPITGMAVIGLDGQFMAATSQMKTGTAGFNGPVTWMYQQPSGFYLVSGGFSSYDKRGNINGITRLKSDGTLDTKVWDVRNPDPINLPDNNFDTASSYNGGVKEGTINKFFYNTTTGSTIGIGNFSNYVTTIYELSTKGSPYLENLRTRQIVKLKTNGEFDSAFNYNLALNSGNICGNGYILDAIQLANGNIIMVGDFTTFNNATVNYITRIDGNTGLIDPTFNSGNTGADGSIDRITYNTTTGKILLCGKFKNYNGAPANGVVMINTDGSRDASFNFGRIDNGLVNYIAQLNNGKIIVSGSFNKYNFDYIANPDKYIVRPGFMILESNGLLAVGYNNTGLFRGTITQHVEVSTNGVPGVFLVGNFDRFDNKEVGNIVKVRLEN